MLQEETGRRKFSTKERVASEEENVGKVQASVAFSPVASPLVSWLPRLGPSSLCFLTYSS